MGDWILPVMVMIIGWGLLVWSANRFVSGAAALASRWKLSPLLIGMVVVGFGTSAPELLVSSIASWQGASGIALGNIVGSNILNISLILALAILFTPIAVQPSVNRVQLPLLLIVSGGVLLLGWDGTLDRIDSVALLGLFSVWIVMLIRASRASYNPTMEPEATLDREEPHPIRTALLGLFVLLVSSRLLVWGAVEMARSFGMSELVIGLTIVGLGTSLPELASAVVSARRGQSELVLGNIVGSNLFNLMAVAGVAGLLRPLMIGDALLLRDLPVSIGITVLLTIFAAGKAWKGELQRWEGGILLAIYIAYTAWLLVGSS
ncbi:MAG: calcium/sodium antiporter [Bacteroidota bacterium]